MTITEVVIVAAVAFVGWMLFKDAMERRERKVRLRARINEQPDLDMVIRDATRMGQRLLERERAQ